ncbi:MAG: hypothetical protein JO227_18770 [Acetobacteraceae bacterium]|nr:hypothetical protein [Acetobacteraceae bacterium]
MPRTARAVLGLSLSFAAATASAKETPPHVQVEPLTSILERIRQDVGYYEVQAAHWRADARQAHPAEPACGTRDWDFDVTNVEANLQTVMEEKESGRVGLHVPLFGKEGSADAGVDRQTSGTQTVALTRHLRYNEEQLALYQESEDYRTLENAHNQYRAHGASGTARANPVLPIADTLLELRKNLISSADKLPCFEWADKDVKPENNSITLEFVAQQATDGTVGFDFWIVSAEADAKVERKNVNTLVVSFAPHSAPAADHQPTARQVGQASASAEGLIR